MTAAHRKQLHMTLESQVASKQSVPGDKLPRVD
eukprot:CAMPEP_0184522986 /NCGR_PEP_ID=MMETSP0198_2-20121128/8616_1 /TAXON_ID=1112570 /ORGANISM="Thraustochytrium sp., Strain LLF1b" /LENGTH=32 /DNA_ID= /DNA_START= /DNA_END= /DNA_ORIENTATION=